MAPLELNLLAMADSEIELAAEIGSGQFLPGGRLSVRYARTWKSRQQSFDKHVLETAGTALEELEQALSDEKVGDLYFSALERAVRVGDSFYREALAALVAGVIDASTPIDIAEAVADRLVRLDVTSLRLLYEIYRHEFDPGHLPSLSHNSPSVAKILHDHPVGQRHLLEPGLAQLEAAGFVKRDIEVSTSGAYGVDPESDVETSFERTDWGLRAYRICRLHETAPD